MVSKGAPLELRTAEENGSVVLSVTGEIDATTTAS
jgi:hypothetical protein